MKTKRKAIMSEEDSHEYSHTGETSHKDRVCQGRYARARESVCATSAARQVYGGQLAATLVLGLLQVGEVSLSSLAQFARNLGVQVSAQVIDERFGPGVCALLAAVARRRLHAVSGR